MWPYLIPRPNRTCSVTHANIKTNMRVSVSFSVSCAEDLSITNLYNYYLYITDIYIYIIYVDIYGYLYAFTIYI